MRLLLTAVPFLVVASATTGWAQSPKPKGNDVLADVRAHLRQSQALPAIRRVSLDYKAAQAKQSGPKFYQAPITYTPTTRRH